MGGGGGGGGGIKKDRREHRSRCLKKQGVDRTRNNSLPIQLLTHWPTSSREEHVPYRCFHAY